MFKKALIFALVFVLAFSCMIPCAFAAKLPDGMPAFPDAQHTNNMNRVYDYAKTFMYYTETEQGRSYHLVFIMSQVPDQVEKLEFFVDNENTPNNYDYLLFKYYSADNSQHLLLSRYQWSDFSGKTEWTIVANSAFYSELNKVQQVAQLKDVSGFVFSDYDIMDYRANADDDYFFEEAPLTSPLQKVVKKALGEEIQKLMGQMMILVTVGVCCLACLICLPLLKKVLSRFL